MARSQEILQYLAQNQATSDRILNVAKAYDKELKIRKDYLTINDVDRLRGKIAEILANIENLEALSQAKLELTAKLTQMKKEEAESIKAQKLLEDLARNQQLEAEKQKLALQLQLATVQATIPSHLQNQYIPQIIPQPIVQQTAIPVKAEDDIF